MSLQPDWHDRRPSLHPWTQFRQHKIAAFEGMPSAGQEYRHSRPGSQAKIWSGSGFVAISRLRVSLDETTHVNAWRAVLSLRFGSQGFGSTARRLLVHPRLAGRIAELGLETGDEPADPTRRHLSAAAL
jgi:hypothetical protein